MENKNIEKIYQKIFVDCKKNRYCSWCKSEKLCKDIFPNWLSPAKTDEIITIKYIKKHLEKQLLKEVVKIKHRGNGAR